MENKMVKECNHISFVNSIKMYNNLLEIYWYLI